LFSKNKPASNKIVVVFLIVEYRLLLFELVLLLSPIEFESSVFSSSSIFDNPNSISGIGIFLGLALKIIFFNWIKLEVSPDKEVINW